MNPSQRHLQARQVRQSAARNLGELTKMSMRVDQLAGDLTTSAKTAEPALRESYLTALCGMLAVCGRAHLPASALQHWQRPSGAVGCNRHAALLTSLAEMTRIHRVTL